MDTVMRNFSGVRNFHPFRKKNKNALPNIYIGFRGIVSTLMFWKYLCKILLTEMDPLLSMNQIMNTQITISYARCKSYQSIFLWVDSDVTIFTCTRGYQKVRRLSL